MSDNYCKRCNVFPIEYAFELDKSWVEWCRFCWAEWWVRGVTEDNPDNFVEDYEETLKIITQSNGPLEVPDGFDQRNIQHLGTSLRRGYAKGS